MAVRTLLSFTATVALALTSTGCDEDATTTPPRTEPPTGGDTFVLDYDLFMTRVAPVLAVEGCAAAGDCHGGGIRGTFQLSPESDPDSRFDFEQAVLQVLPYSPDESPLLLKPLAVDAGGDPHAADAFTTSADPGFQAIAEWIADGSFE